EYTTSAFRFRAGELTLAKMTEPLEIVWSRPLPKGATPSTVTVSQDAAGRWHVSLLCEDPTVKPLAATDAAVGVDAGLDHLLTLSTGEKISNSRHERRDRTRLARAQRHLARKAPGEGANRAKARRKVARIHDRDVNAARNILAAGLAVSACGAGVRPQRSTPGGQSATKQEPPRREP
ncbi:transposase, partial [Streptomyces sparsogenes]|uniref:RNA-guided endonuclease InsQ/TnpB family protein n=1 Tax=Streptomyces sparsogenes TaxID=67365 RepID=UPI0033C2B323